MDTPVSLTYRSSSDASVQLCYLDGRTPRSPSADVSVGLAASPRLPFSSPADAASLRTATSTTLPNAPPLSPAERAPNEPIPGGAKPSLWARAMSALRGAGGRLDRLLLDGHSAAGGAPVAVQSVRVDESEADRVPPLPTLRDTDEAEEDAESAWEAEPMRIEIDLRSTLRGYRKNPNECLGHLVVAALSGRSRAFPVTGEELRVARRMPFLVQLIVDSGALDLEDPVAQEEVRRCVDELIPAEAHYVLPCAYEHLVTFFQLPFVRLTAEQYVVLKSSGFEFVQLLCVYPHVLPPQRINSTSINYGCVMRNVDFLLMVLNTLTEAFCLASIALIIGHWLSVEGQGYQKYGYYTIIIYGIGFAAHFISMVFLARGKERDVVYGKMLSVFPSSHLHVVPVLPLFNVVCILTYLRYHVHTHSLRRYVAVMHDIVAIQTLSSLSFAVCVAMPQGIAQKYLSEDDLFVPERIGNTYAQTMLTVATILTWLLSMARLFRSLMLHDSINCFGFACFGFHYDRIIEWYSALPRGVFASCLFVFELNVFFLVGSLIGQECLNKATITLSSMSIIILLVVFGLLLLSRKTVFRIMWSMAPLTVLQLLLLIMHRAMKWKGKCSFLRFLQSDTFFLLYFIWGVYFLLVLLFLIQLVVIFSFKRRLPTMR